MKINIFILAGELSGDIIGADLILALKTKHNNLNFIGIGGQSMIDAGCKVLYDIKKIEAFGIFEILTKLPSLIKIRRKILKYCLKIKPKIFIGVDFPDFNLYLEKILKKNNIKTIHYVSPSFWAWRYKRIFQIKKATNLVLSIFPFEKKFFDKFNIPCNFVGHPIADKMILNPSKKYFREILKLNRNDHFFTILPGSRICEIKILSAIFLKTAKIVKNNNPDIKIIAAMVNIRCAKQFEKIKKKIAPDLKIILKIGCSREVMISSNVSLVASGTATLECMLAKCPMVVGYRVNILTFFLIKLLIKTSYISIPNILAGKKIVKEFLQNDCKPKILAEEINSLLHEKNKRSNMLNFFFSLHKKIRNNASSKAAEAISYYIK